MAARSMQITFHNQTDQDLTVTSSSLDHGIWSDGAQPPDMGPSSDHTFQMESDGVMTGCESTVTWSIGGTGDVVSLHTCVPYAGQNWHRFDLSTGYGLTVVEQQGDNVSYDVTLAPAGDVAVPGFRPSTQGLPFSNYWDPGTTDTTLDLGIVRIPIGDAHNGLCGGMAYAARDYFEAGQPVPPESTPHKHEGDPLFDFLFHRLVDSFDLPNLPLTLMKLMDPAYPDTDDNALSTVGLANGRAYVTARQTWPQAKAVIDSGHPVPICLVKVKSLNPGDLGENHQVLVWAYRMDGVYVTLFVYDPNNPGRDDCAVTFSIGRTDQPMSCSTAVLSGPILCIVPTAYAPSALPDLSAGATADASAPADPAPADPGPADPGTATADGGAVQDAEQPAGVGASAGS